MVLTLEDGNGSPKKRNTQKASSDIPVSPAIPIDSAHTAMDLLDAALKDAEAQNQSLKVMFRKLALKHHPDKGGNKQVFQTICQIRDAVLPMIGENKPSNSEKMDLSETLKQIAEICSFSCVMNLMDAIGKEKPNLTQAELITPTIHTVESTYEHQSSNPHENRKHALEAQSNEALQEKFLGQTGDQLKTSILNDFKEQIENTSDPEELASLKDKLKSSEEFKVLQKGQGRASNIVQSIEKMVNRDLYKTSSVRALEKMFNQQEENLSPKQSNSI